MVARQLRRLRVVAVDPSLVRSRSLVEQVDDLMQAGQPEAFHVQQRLEVSRHLVQPHDGIAAAQPVDDLLRSLGIGQRVARLPGFPSKHREVRSA
jgi:hypothetical protein